MNSRDNRIPRQPATKKIISHEKKVELLHILYLIEDCPFATVEAVMFSKNKVIRSHVRMADMKDPAVVKYIGVISILKPVATERIAFHCRVLKKCVS